MEYLVKNKKLELKYAPNKGAWTYHILIPNTKHILGRWGFLKASGTIDNYKIENKNLFTITGQDKLISINAEIRKAINKTGGDLVTVTLYLSAPKEQITEKQVLETFKESNVLKKFQKLTDDEKSEILTNIISQKSEDKQIKAIIKQIDILGK
jgi:Domain of unknown function (DUF1905)